MNAIAASQWIKTETRNPQFQLEHKLYGQFLNQCQRLQLDEQWRWMDRMIIL